MKIFTSTIQKIILGIFICFDLLSANIITRNYWDNNTHLWNVSCNNGHKISVARTKDSMFTTYNITKRSSSASALSLNEAISKACSGTLSSNKIITKKGALIFDKQKKIINALLDDEMWDVTSWSASKIPINATLDIIKYYSSPKVFKGKKNGQIIYEFDTTKSIDKSIYKLIPLIDGYYKVSDADGYIYFFRASQVIRK